VGHIAHSRMRDQSTQGARGPQTAILSMCRQHEVFKGGVYQTHTLLWKQCQVRQERPETIHTLKEVEAAPSV
jgi:hypothetical protein